MAEQRAVQMRVVSQSAINREQRVERVALFDDTGAARVLPKEGATVAAPGALTSAQISGGESPTQTEHNNVQTDVAALQTTLAALITSLKNADVIASS
jgi:carbohydrate-binding DOMON domain-containing protein